MAAPVMTSLGESSTKMLTATRRVGWARAASTLALAAAPVLVFGGVFAATSHRAHAKAGSSKSATKSESKPAKGASVNATDSTNQKNPTAVMETSMGTVTIELFADKAPETVKNFLQYAADSFYDDTIFHRVIDGFMIQGGGFTADMRQKPTRAPVKNEAKPDVRNLRGTLSMARTNDPDSATAQFFINVRDNASLDRSGSAPGGYTVFGKVTDGMDVVDKIKATRTTSKSMYDDVPVTPIVIKSVRRK